MNAQSDGVVSKETGERWADAEIYRLNGKIALAAGGSQNVEKAKHHLNRSLSIAEEQSSIMFRLRTLFDLYELTSGEDSPTASQIPGSLPGDSGRARDSPSKAIRN
jgi:hypothetical protein